MNKPYTLRELQEMQFNWQDRIPHFTVRQMMDLHRFISAAEEVPQYVQGLEIEKTDSLRESAQIG